MLDKQAQNLKAQIDKAEAQLRNREWGQMGQNYLRSLFALGFQAFLIMVCVGIYAALVQTISVEQDVSKAIWTCVGYRIRV